MTNSTLHLPFKEILKSIPGFFGIRLEEEPRFEVVESSGDVEVRRYAPALLAEVTLAAPHDEAIDEGFDILAKYIFGENAPKGRLPRSSARSADPGVTMEMTTPVLQSPTDKGWTVSFFLGNDMKVSEAPAPKDPRVELRIEPAYTVAVKRYSGNNDADKRATTKQELTAWVNASERWHRDSKVFWAQYDAPFVIPFLKRNEAMIQVVSTA